MPGMVGKRGTHALDFVMAVQKRLFTLDGRLMIVLVPKPWLNLSSLENEYNFPRSGPARCVLLDSAVQV